MSKPVDLKTVKIFEPLKKKPSFENKIFNTLNADEVYDVLSSHSNETVTLWFKLQQSWCNNAYSTFRDYDSYLILIYLVNQVFQKYSDRFQYLSFQEFYEKNYYIDSKTALLTFIGPLGQWRFGGKTESSRNFYLNNKFNSTSIGIGLKGDRRNNRWLPYSGKYWVWNLNIGHQNDIYGKTQIIDSYFQLDKYKSLNSSVLRFSMWGGRNWIDDRELSASKK